MTATATLLLIVVLLVAAVAATAFFMHSRSRTVHVPRNTVVVARYPTTEYVVRPALYDYSFGTGYGFYDTTGFRRDRCRGCDSSDWSRRDKCCDDKHRDSPREAPREAPRELPREAQRDNDNASWFTTRAFDRALDVLTGSTQSQATREVAIDTPVTRTVSEPLPSLMDTTTQTEATPGSAMSTPPFVPEPMADVPATSTPTTEAASDNVPATNEGPDITDLSAVATTTPDTHEQTEGFAGSMVSPRTPVPYAIAGIATIAGIVAYWMNKKAVDKAINKVGQRVRRHA